MRQVSTAALIAFLGLFAATAAIAQAPAAGLTELELGQDRFVAGDDVAVTKPVSGDLIIAGGEVNVRTDIAGDLLATGGKVEVRSPVQQDAFIAGGDVTLGSAIRGNARLAGGKVALLPGARIDGNAIFGGGELNIGGEVGGYLLAGGGRIYINAPIGGDVRLGGGEVELGPNARIQGNLRYRSRNELRRAPGAVVTGTVERVPMERPTRGPVSRVLAGLLIWCLGLGVLATILLTATPSFAERVSAAARTNPGRSLLLGLIALVLIPMAAIIAIVTIIGIPLGVLALLAYPILLLIGYVLAAVALADVMLQRMRPARAGERKLRILAAFIALLLLALLAQIPVLGGVLILLVLLVGAGAILQQLRRGDARTPAQSTA